MHSVKIACTWKPSLMNICTIGSVAIEYFWESVVAATCTTQCECNGAGCVMKAAATVFVAAAMTAVAVA